MKKTFKLKNLLVSLLTVCVFALFLSGCGDTAANETASGGSTDTLSVSEPASVSADDVLPAVSETMTALEDATNYLNTMPLSRETLIAQLEYDGFSHEEAVAAADNCGADWNEMALRHARSYLDTMDFTYDELLDQLEYDKYTPEQAKYAVDAVLGAAADASGADDVLPAVSETMTALEDAVNYLKVMPLSRETLIAQLEYDGFSHEEAVAAADNCGADWNEMAVRHAQSYLDTMEFTYDELLDQLEYDKYTPEQAKYGVDNCGKDWNA